MTVETTIARLAPVWQKRIGLAHFDITHVFLDSYYGDDGEEDFKVTAVTESRWQYLQAKIKWYLPSAVRHDAARLEEILVHELCHVLLAPEQTHMKARHSEHLELATEMVARAVLAGWKGTK
jgi:hypothetical protein